MQKYLDFFSYYQTLQEAEAEKQNIPVNNNQEIKKLSLEELNSYYTWSVTSTELSNKSNKSTITFFKNFISYLYVINNNQTLSNLFGSTLLSGPTANKIANGDKTIIINNKLDKQGNEIKGTLEDIFEEIKFRNTNANNNKNNMKIQPFIDGNIGIFLDVDSSLSERVNTAVFYLLAFDKINTAESLIPAGNVYCFGVNFKQTSVFSKVFSPIQDSNFLLSLFKPMDGAAIAANHFVDSNKIRWVKINENKYIDTLYNMGISLPFSKSNLSDPKKSNLNNIQNNTQRPDASPGDFTVAQAQTTTEYIIKKFEKKIMNEDIIKNTFFNLFLSESERKLHSLIRSEDFRKKLSAEELRKYLDIEEGIKGRLEAVQDIKLTFYKAVGNTDPQSAIKEAVNIQDPNNTSLESNRAKVYIEFEINSDLNLKKVPVLFSTKNKMSQKGQNFLKLLRNAFVKAVEADNNIKIKDNGYIYEVYVKNGPDSDIIADSNTHGFFSIILGKSAGKESLLSNFTNGYNTDNYNQNQSLLYKKNRRIKMRT